MQILVVISNCWQIITLDGTHTLQTCTKTVIFALCSRVFRVTDSKIYSFLIYLYWPRISRYIWMLQLCIIMICTSDISLPQTVYRIIILQIIFVHLYLHTVTKWYYGISKAQCVRLIVRIPQVQRACLCINVSTLRSI